jgi:hypothetical protein
MKQRPNLTLPSPKLEVYLPDRSMLTERRTPHTKCSSARDTQGYSGFGWAWFGGGDTRVAPSGIGGWKEDGIQGAIGNTDTVVNGDYLYTWFSV